MPSLKSASIFQEDKYLLDIIYHSPVFPSPTGPTLLFLPFYGGSANTFTSVLSSLATYSPTIPTVAVSHRGTGDKHNLPADDSPSNYAVPALATSLATALATSPILQNLTPSHRLILVAHSLSAKIVYHVIHSPLFTLLNNAGLTVSSIVLLAPAPPSPLALPAELRQQQLTAYASADNARWTVSNILTYRQLAEDIIDALAKDAAGMSDGAKRGWLENVIPFDCTLSTQTTDHDTPIISSGDIKTPLKVTILVGSEDKVETVEKVRNESVPAWKAAGHEVSVKVVEEAGHLLPVEATEEVVRAVVIASATAA